MDFYIILINISLTIQKTFCSLISIVKFKLPLEINQISKLILELNFFHKFYKGKLQNIEVML